MIIRIFGFSQNKLTMIDYCKQFFGKSIQELSFEDIEEYFQAERVESTNIEFKSGQDSEKACNSTLVDKIIKSICGFLNSEGGVLIWGTPREEKASNSKYKIAKGELKPNDHQYEKDSLVRQITTSISYLPVGIKVAVLSKENKHVYIFEVQESKNKPHQYKHEYLIRIDGHTQAAPHFLIDSMFKQINHADTEIGLHLYDFHRQQGYLTLYFKMVVFNFSRYMPARNVNVNLYSNAGEFNSTGNRDININTIDSISFGSFPSSKYSLMIKENVLERFDNIIELNITSSGHNCLSKVSVYKINVDKILNGEDDIVPNELLENIKSNIPLIDLINANSSKEEIKRMFLEV